MHVYVTAVDISATLSHYYIRIVQSFYENLGVNLKQIATQTLLAASGAEKCAL